jgi:predicted ribosome quality control (RQC) complex YloA/Tae2 family protein
MEYLTLKRHCTEMTQELADRPLIMRVFAVHGRGICLQLKRQAKKNRLVLQLDQASQGFWLSNKAQEIETKTSFIRQLERLLVNGHLAGLSLYAKDKAFDRVVEIHVAAFDSFFGTRNDYFLIVELTGRIANIFLCDSEHKIIDSLARTNNNETGSKYNLPAAGAPIDPLVATPAQLAEIFSSDSNTWQNKIGGFSPQIARELAFRTRNEKTIEALVVELKKLFAEAQNSDKTWLATQNQKVKFLSVYYPHSQKQGDIKEFARVNEALEFIEMHLAGKNRFEQTQKQIKKHFSRELKARRELVKKQQALKQKYQNASELQKMGNLIVANIYRIKPGDKEVLLQDWESNEPVLIKLDPTKSAAAQADRYFHKYKKARRGIAEVEKRLKELNLDIRWLEEQIWLVENASEAADLPIIEKKRAQKPKATKQGSKRKKPYFPVFLEMNDCRYYVGKNGRQNDLLTFSVARKNDLWFHANDVPGAHVILKKLNGEATEEDIVSGALLAAWFSFARESSKVPVDTTEVARVKKVPGGGPGRVSYTHQKTVFVNPQDAKKLVEMASEETS